MKNQSSLNDVFRFVQLRQPNKITLIETKFVDLIKYFKPEERITQANNLLEPNSGQGQVVHDIDTLKYGNHILTSLKKALEEEAPTVATFYDLIDDITIPQTDAFNFDLERLSNTILLAKFATENIPYNLSDLEKLYIIYFTLKQASINEAYLALPLDRALNAVISYALPDSEKEQSKTNSRIQSVGIADLLVVKQHILRYEATEIAHIENIMAGETRSREHRYLDRFEETLTFEIETTTEQEKELQTTERFEMNRETSRTIKEDQKYGAELSISASYGPTVQVNAGFEMEISRSEENTSKNASTYAKDIMERSLERVKERVREERIRKIIRETEEKNTHSFKNTNLPSEHISGIYQFVDKIYKAQVFNYGKRQMFDLMIPEPASYLWYLENQPSINAKDSEALKKFDINPFKIVYSYDEITIPDSSGKIIPNPDHYTELAKLYRATGIEPPPANMEVSFAHQQPGSSASGTPDALRYASEGRPQGDGKFLAPMRILDITIPNGYIPKKAVLFALAGSDSGDLVSLDFVFGQVDGHLLGREMDRPEHQDEVQHLRYGFKALDLAADDLELRGNKNFISDNKLKLALFVYESANHAITGKVECEPSEDLIQKWQLKTYDTIQSAYQDRLLEYQDEQSRIRAEQKAQEEQQNRVIGIPPAKRKQVLLHELKKHAIAIFTNNYLHNSAWESNNPMEETAPPKFDVSKAINQGNFIRFFENAFEWDQIQYAFYPYFWHTNKDNWADRFLKDDPDYEYQQFLQAGAARIVLPARPGFEEAIAHYLETDEIWNGAGTPPRIGDPLYVSIIQEIRESTGGRTDEATAVGKPWEVRLPTNLILLKQNSDLPKWKEKEEGNWEWEADLSEEG